MANGERIVKMAMQEKGIDEAFWPIFELDEAPEKGKGSHWAVRIGLGLALVASIWALQAYAPDKGVLQEPVWVFKKRMGCVKLSQIHKTSAA